MEPVPRKPFVECPRCGSPEVHVPWEPARLRLRRRALFGLVALGATIPAWVAFGTWSGSILWLLALPLYLFAAARLGIIVYDSSRAYRCAACRLRWRGRSVMR